MAADEAGRPVVDMTAAALATDLVVGLELTGREAVTDAVGTKAEKADRCSWLSDEDGDDCIDGDTFIGEDEEATVADEWADRGAEAD